MEGLLLASTGGIVTDFLQLSFLSTEKVNHSLNPNCSQVIMKTLIAALHSS